MKNIKLVVGVDMDGTLTHMSEYFYETKNFFRKDIVNKDAYSLEDMYDVSSKKVILWGLIYLIDYCKNSKVNNSTLKTVKKLIKDGNDVHCITARKYVTFNNFIGSYMRKLVIKYNEKYKINFLSYNFCSEKEVCRDKYLNCFRKGVDIMFEDKPDVALYLAKKGIVVGLVDAPYNKDVKHKNIYRCKKITDYEILINKVKNEKNEKFKNYKIDNINLNNDEFQNLNEELKKIYIQKYKEYLKGLTFDEKQLEIGKKRYSRFYNLLMIGTLRKLFTSVEGKKNLIYGIDAVYVSNHLDSFDQFSIVYGIGNKYVCGFAAHTIENTKRGKIFKYLHSAVFIDRNNKESKKKGTLELEKIKIRENSILIFPEGTRKNKYKEHNDKEILDFKLGAFNIAQKTSSVIIPVTLYKKNEKSIFTKVIFGEAVLIKPEDDVVKISKEIQQSILKNIRKEKSKHESK